MNARQRAAFDEEIAMARGLMLEGRLDEAFPHLERAHVLGQQHVLPHTLAHWLMLRIAVRQRESLAVVGQAVRIVLGIIGSSLGSVPTGNTGGTDISMFARLPIEPDLVNLMKDQWDPDTVRTLAAADTVRRARPR